MKPGMTLAEREAERQLLRDRSIAAADRLGRTQRCRWANDGIGAPESHALCRGEGPRNSGCLCECHDPESAQQGDIRGE